ncbi:MAG: hypothetical protein WC501_04160 [Candidatus Micrarchaeia archaeon]
MKLPFFLKFFLVAVALSLVSFAFTEDAGIIFLLKLLALSTALSIFVALLYPSIRGLKKGDRVLVSIDNLPSFFGIGRTGYAIENGKINSQIKVRLSDGREAVGIVESYGGSFNLPKVRLIYEESIRE